MGSNLIQIVTWLIQSVSIVAVLIGLYKSFIEYRNAQRWKRAEFVSKEVKEFFADKNVSRALIFLDYRENDIPVYENELEGKTTLRYNNEILLSALDTEKSIEDFTAEELLIRKIFDDFFTKLGFFNHYLDTKLVDIKDIKPYFDYWMNLLANPQKSYRNKKVMHQIWLFIEKFNQNEVKILAHKFKFNPNFKIPDAKKS